MKKILILGSGLVAKPIIQYLLSKGYQVTVASNTPDRSDNMIAGDVNGISLFWDAGDEDTLVRLIEDHDITVSLLPYIFHVMVARYCVAHKKNMVTTSYVKPEMKLLDAVAREAGIILLNEMGLDPGIDHMSAMRIIDKVHEREGAILGFYSICGALPAPEAADNPFKYKFSWSPKGVVLAGNNDAVYLHHGNVIERRTRDLFKNPFRVNFPEIGELEVYPNRDSLTYKEIYGIPETRTIFRGTFRYKGWCETLDAMKQLNLISPEKYDMTGMTFADMVSREISTHKAQHQDTNETDTMKQVDAKVKPAPASVKRHTTQEPDQELIHIGIIQQVADYLGIPVNSHSIQAMKWLGLFEQDSMNRQVDSTFEVTSDLMIEKMSLGQTERDMVALQHTFLAAFSDGRKEVIRSRMLDFGTLATDTSIARTVALPAAIGVEMILNGEIKVKGVHVPVIPEIYNPVLGQLEKMGIKMVEEFGLPISEMIDQ